MNMKFLNIMLCYYFSLEAVLQGVTQNTKIPRCRNSGDVEANASVLTHRREKVKLIVTNFNYKLQLLASECQKQSPRVVLWKRCS